MGDIFGGGGSNRTVQTTTNAQEPWSAAQPALKKGISEATRLYDQQAGFQPFGKSLVVDFSDKTKDGMEGIVNSASTFGGEMSKGLGFTSGLFDSGGWNTPQVDALNNTSGVAAGNELFGANPGFQRIKDMALDDVRLGVNKNAMAMGRYGSGAHQDVLQEGLADVSARMLSDEYTRQLGRMDNANQQLFQMGQTGIGNQTTATQLQPQAYNTMQQPYRDVMGVGSMEEDLATRTLNDELRVHNEAQEAPWDRLLALQGIASGAGRVGGSSTASVLAPTASPFQSIVGGALQSYGAGEPIWQGALGGLLG
jgi:hypothetical protein